jgi:gamma-glutamylcyclotransferase (GGCT)/AIG2-like uncharacterized protein YtfP
MTPSADTRLAVYGTLAPGEPNHHQLTGLEGSWRRGKVRGRLYPRGWSATLGYPALILDPASDEVPVQIFESGDLPGHWARLDAFEGEGYRRVVAWISTADGAVEAQIYAAA